MCKMFSTIALRIQSSFPFISLIMHWASGKMWILEKVAFLYLREKELSTNASLARRIYHKKPTTKSTKQQENRKRMLIVPEHFVGETNCPDFLFRLQILWSLCKSKGLVLQQRHSRNWKQNHVQEPCFQKEKRRI